MLEIQDKNVLLTSYRARLTVSSIHAKISLPAENCCCMFNKRISERCDCCKVPRNINMSAVNEPINFLVVVSIAAAFF